MREKLDNFLLGTLWLLACMLGSCFWFKTMYGFNIFSGTHWRYLGQMQATQTAVKPTFYISLIIAVSITIFGLYTIIKPRLKRLNLPFIKIREQPTVMSRPARNNRSVPPAKNVTQAPATTQPDTPSEPTSTPAPTTPTNTPDASTNGLARPPRLNIPTSNTISQPSVPFTAPTAPTTATTTSQPSAIDAEQIQESPELREIFESTGYILKDAPRIAGLQTSLFAIGSNESIWIGAIGIETKTMSDILDTINQIFLDTLDDVEIGLNGFVVSPADADNPASPKILTFDSTDALRNYMEEHKNPPVRDEEAENFEAFSDYISTVIDYIGKL